ncbi:MAG TPA: 2'-5' RNA ligase family protein [Rubrobacteraceae bacterium]|nr:2'-5' RNA ligase family protein [Rubrobacteraceae bacterium]
MIGYEEVWERFVRERRLEFGGHTDPSWRDGHSLSASFVIPVEASRLRGRLDPLRDALRPFPFVSLHPDHFLHLTLMPLGFLAEEPRADDEISREGLEGLEADARQALSGYPAFSVRLANLNAFPGAAFVEVRDGGMLEELRDALREGCALDKPSGPPHLTLAYFQAPDGSPAPEDLISSVARYRDWPVGELAVESVQLTLLDLHVEYPEPDILAEISLER